jgi:hypothetical protein
MNTKDLYRQLIQQVLVENNVKSIIRITAVKEDFFDRIEVYANGTLGVYRHGMSMCFDNFYFDFTCDFARCLSYIEDEIYMQKRAGKPQHGYQVIFK